MNVIKYHFTSPEYFREQSNDNTIPFSKENVTIDIDNDDVDNKELTIKLLA